MHLADLVIDAGVIQDAFGERGFPGVDMGHDPKIAHGKQRHESAFRFLIVAVIAHNHCRLALLRIRLIRGYQR